MTQTTFAGSSPWAGLTVPNASKTAKERPLAPRQKPPTTEERSPRSVKKTLKHTNIPVGESRPNTILKEEQALEIYAAIQKYRKLQAEMKKVSPTAMAKKYGISDKTISGIESGRSWNYVTGARSQQAKRSAR